MRLVCVTNQNKEINRKKESSKSKNRKIKGSKNNIRKGDKRGYLAKSALASWTVVVYVLIYIKKKQGV
jgi:hypothetical protein